ncbi:MAG: peptidase M23, partial [Aquificaceae bacterium]
MKDHISIIIAYHEGKAPKTIRIRKVHLKVAFSLFLLFLFVSLSSYLLNLSFISKRKSLAMKEEKLAEEILRLHMEKESLVRELENLEKEKKKLKEKIAHIEKNISLIEEHLAKRGVIKKPLGVGGASYK